MDKFNSLTSPFIQTPITEKISQEKEALPSLKIGSLAHHKIIEWAANEKNPAALSFNETIEKAKNFLLNSVFYKTIDSKPIEEVLKIIEQLDAKNVRAFRLEETAGGLNFL